MDHDFLDMEDEAMDEEAPAWLTSYSDMMTDLLAIFVILFSFAMMMQASTAMAADSAVKNASTTAVISAEAPVQEAEQVLADGQERFNNFYEELKSYIDDNGLSKQLSVAKEGNDVVLLRMADSALFDPAQAEINPQADEVMECVSDILAEYGSIIQMVRIEGHTDDRPINTKQFNTNWELSTARAVNVLKRLLEISTLGSKKFSAVGYSEFYPIADNATPEGRAQNRRVDFIIETE